MEESSILSKFDRLVESGIVLYDDKQEIIEHIDGDLKFQFVLTSSLAKKPTFQGGAARPPPPPSPAEELQQTKREGSDIDTRGFEIGPLGSTHFVAANKFCYARPHLMLLTTDGHQKQYDALGAADLAAAWAALEGLTATTTTTATEDYAVFYNCGRDGGCSRLHKHMQLMPTPRHSFAAFLDDDDTAAAAAGKEEPNVPYHWFYHRFRGEGEGGGANHLITPARLTKVYGELLARATAVGAGRAQHADTLPPGAACPHNMVLTKRWMVVLPRRRAGINKEAGANAVGMLGYIAVATQNEIDNWIRLGLTDSLRELGVPKKE